MLTVGGLLLGAVLTAPVAAGGAAPTDPLEPTEARVANAQGNAALGLRDPFAPDPHHLHAAATRRRVPRPSDTDLRNPFEAASVRPASPVPEAPTADLRSPFQPPTRVTAPAHPPDLRDPFDR